MAPYPQYSSLNPNAPKTLPQPSGPIPGAGIFNSIGSFFSGIKPFSSPVAPKSSPMLQGPSLPGVAGQISGGMPSFPSLGGGNAPVVQPQVAPVAPAKSAASSQPITGGRNYAAMSEAEMTAYLQNKSHPATSGQALVSQQPPATPLTPDLSSYPVGNVGAQNFNVQTTGSTFDSSKLSPGALQDLMDARNAKEAAMNGGTNLDGSPKGMSEDGKPFIPSDTLQGQIANQLYQSKLFTPDEQSMIQNGQDLTAQINAKKLAERRKTSQLLEDGTITREQANSFVAESERRANQDLADLSVQQDSNTAKLTALGLIRQNQVGALQSVSDLLKGSEVAPGSSVYNPITGVQYQGQGASAATINSNALSLAQQDLTYGQPVLDANGQIDMNHYLQQAQQNIAFANGQGGASSQGSSGQGGYSSGGSANSSQPQAQGGASPIYQYGISKGLPPVLAGSVTQSPVTGDYYMSGAKVTPGAEQQAFVQQGKSGIAFVPKENVPNIQQLDIAIGQMKALSELAPQFLSSGIMGRIKGLTTNQLQSYFQTDPGWAKFNAVRLQAIDYLKGLAQGGGFRTTESEINTAANSLLSVSDNLESAQAKMDTAMKNINLAYREYLPTHKDTSLTSAGAGSSQTQSSGSGLYSF